MSQSFEEPCPSKHLVLLPPFRQQLERTPHVNSIVRYIHTHAFSRIDALLQYILHHHPDQLEARMSGHVPTLDEPS